MFIRDFRDILDDVRCEAARVESRTRNRSGNGSSSLNQKAASAVIQSRRCGVTKSLRSDMLKPPCETEGVECLGNKSNQLNLVLPY